MYVLSIFVGVEVSRQGTNSIGTTKRGIGPCYSAKAIRALPRFRGVLLFFLLGFIWETMGNYGKLWENVREVRDSYISLHMLEYDSTGCWWWLIVVSNA